MATMFSSLSVIAKNNIINPLLAGNRLTLTDAENKTSNFAYDDLGRLKTETDHLGLATTNKLDEAGNAYE